MWISQFYRHGSMATKCIVLLELLFWMSSMYIFGLLTGTFLALAFLYWMNPYMANKEHKVLRNTHLKALSCGWKDACSNNKIFGVMANEQAWTSLWHWAGTGNTGLRFVLFFNLYWTFLLIGVENAWPVQLIAICFSCLSMYYVNDSDLNKMIGLYFAPFSAQYVRWFKWTDNVNKNSSEYKAAWMSPNKSSMFNKSGMFTHPYFVYFCLMVGSFMVLRMFFSNFSQVKVFILNWLKLADSFIVNGKLFGDTILTEYWDYAVDCAVPVLVKFFEFMFSTVLAQFLLNMGSGAWVMFMFLSVVGVMVQKTNIVSTLTNWYYGWTDSKNKK